MIRLLLVLILIISCGNAFDIEPANPQPGDRISITGMASPGERVSIQSSFAMELPVADRGVYSYETSVEIPQKPNRFSVTVRDVRDVTVGVKLGIWITKRIQASGGSVSLSQSQIPPGRYCIMISGEALPGVTSVPVDVTAETSVEADPSGRYSLIIDTSGVPPGEYVIRSGGETKVVRLGTSAGSGSGESLESESARFEKREVEITDDVIRWYAGTLGLDPGNVSEYEMAEDQLKKRLAGGYWKVIARGDPLTEEAGNCESEYCIVRGIGACTSCREKDMMIKRSRAGEKIANTSINASSSKDPEEYRPDKMRSWFEEIVSLVSGWFRSLLSVLR